MKFGLKINTEFPIKKNRRHPLWPP